MPKMQASSHASSRMARPSRVLMSRLRLTKISGKMPKQSSFQYVFSAQPSPSTVFQEESGKRMELSFPS